MTGSYDGVVYIASKNTDLDSIKAQNFKFKNVPNKFLIANEAVTETYHTAAELNLTILEAASAIPQEIYINEKKTHLLLKQVYRKIDADNSGYIEVKELRQANVEMGEQADASLTAEMAIIDVNGDGRITFEEFKGWWKKGRQGAKRARQILTSLAGKLSSRVPGSIKALGGISGLLRDRRSNKLCEKKLHLKIGDDFTEGKLQLKFSAGTGIIGENLIRQPM